MNFSHSWFCVHLCFQGTCSTGCQCSGRYPSRKRSWDICTGVCPFWESLWGWPKQMIQMNIYIHTTSIRFLRFKLQWMYDWTSFVQSTLQWFPFIVCVYQYCLHIYRFNCHRNLRRTKKLEKLKRMGRQRVARFFSEKKLHTAHACILLSIYTYICLYLLVQGARTIQEPVPSLILVGFDFNEHVVIDWTSWTI